MFQTNLPAVSRKESGIWLQSIEEGIAHCLRNYFDVGDTSFNLGCNSVLDADAIQKAVRREYFFV